MREVLKKSTAYEFVLQIVLSAVGLVGAYIYIDIYAHPNISQLKNNAI